MVIDSCRRWQDNATGYSYYYSYSALKCGLFKLNTMARSAQFWYLNVSYQTPDLRYGNGYHIITCPPEIEYITTIWYVKKGFPATHCWSQIIIKRIESSTSFFVASRNSRVTGSISCQELTLPDICPNRKLSNFCEEVCRDLDAKGFAKTIPERARDLRPAYP